MTTIQAQSYDGYFRTHTGTQGKYRLLEGSTTRINTSKYIHGFISHEQFATPDSRYWQGHGLLQTSKTGDFPTNGQFSQPR